MVGASETDNGGRSVTSAKSNENVKSGAFTGSNSNPGGSFTGVAPERPTLSGSGIKSLQSTAKKNRIIINDDLRSQHKMQQQLAQQDKPAGLSRHQQRGARKQGRDDDAMDDFGPASTSKAGDGQESRAALRSYN